MSRVTLRVPPSLLEMIEPRLTNGRGVGIRNTCERLQVLYGERGVVQVHNTEPGLRVALSFPAESAAQLAA